MLNQNTRTNIKNFLKNILPENLFTNIRTFYIKHFAKLFDENKVLQKYTNIFLQKYGKEIIDGPFKGLKYVSNSVGSSYLHKLAGYYEAVLHPYVYEVSKLNIQNILDIGAAEGYYTTGFGKFFPNAEIVAFEMDNIGHKFIKEMHEINNLTNSLKILGEANSENITQFIKPNTLLIVDCEGAEKTILDIKDKNLFKNVAFGIIELHDELVPGCKNAVSEYFKDTHNIEFVKFQFANPSEFSFLKSIEDKSDLNVLLRERGIQDQEWVILRLK